MRFGDLADERCYASYLYALLKEREDYVNISHKELPSFQNHVDFIASNPYKEWKFIYTDTKHGERLCGAYYITKHNEIGLFMFKLYQGQGLGKEALAKIIDEHKGERLLANINPANTKSIGLFGSFGFKHIQNTYEL